MASPKTNSIANVQSAMGAAQTALFSFFFFLSVLALCLTPATVNASVTFTISPSVVSNAYNGLITLQINGLTNGVTNVVVQKFLDVNTNSRIDSGDLLVQQFRLSVGQVNVFTNEATSTPVTVTNFMPGDTSSVTNQMTIPLNFQNGDFAQTLVGQYLYKISSLTNSATNLFVVTNSAFPCVVTGAVVNAGTFPNFTNIPNALVLLCLDQSGPIVVQAGTVANSSGTFSFRAPPGNYVMTAAKSNFVEDISTEGLTLIAKTTTNGSVGLTPATTNITGRIINSANSNGLAGISGTMISTNELLSFYFTDTNGNFYAPVTTNLWEAPVDAFAAAFQSYLTFQSNSLLNVSNKTVNLTNSLPPASAIFYGVVSNNSAVPMPGVYVYALDNAGHQSIGMTDSHGKYVVGASAGTNIWNVFVLFPDNPGLTNSAYVFAPGFLQTNGLGADEAVQQNFSVLVAPYSISGTVEDFDGNPVVGVQVFATNGTYSAASAVTASDGSYALNVSPGTWTVGVDATSLLNLGFTNAPPPNKTVTISDSSATGVNFLIEVCGEISILTTNLVDGIVGSYYETNLIATSCQTITNWAPAYGITLTSIYETNNVVYPAGTPIYANPHLLGYLETEIGVSNGYDSNLRHDVGVFINCSGAANPVNSGFQFDNVTATINVTGPITNGTAVTINNKPWTVTQDTTPNGSNYTTTVTCSALPDASGDYAFETGWFAGVGTQITTGSAVSNRVASVLGAFHSITTFGISAVAASSIPDTNLDNSVVFIEQGGHIAQYFISAFGPQSTNLPPGMSLYPAGTLAGTPTGTGTNGGVFNFSVMAEDASSDVTVQPLSMFIFPAATLTGSTSAQAGMLQSSNTFQLYLNGLTNEFNYTVFMTTNLASANWMPIFTINNPDTNSVIVPDTTATNATRFYRLQISQ